MSIKIHHGPPGSYKSAGAVTDDLIPALTQGRSIVTNVRGLTLDVVHENFDNLPDDFVLHWIDTTTREGRERLGAWFTWAPHGALIFIDEAQAIFPKRWKEKDLEKYTIDEDEAKRLNRPSNWWDAWDMHRHFNWDVILTTPDIDKIRDDIRDASELAYKHKNQGIYGWLFKGSYLEGVHSKDNSGKATSNFINTKQKRIKNDALTWKLYKSTATGEISDTIAGFNLFSNPRLVIGIALIALSLGYFGYNSGGVLDAPKPNKNTVATSKTNSPVYPQKNPSSPLNPNHNSDTTGEITEIPVPVVEHPLSDYTFTYNGNFKSNGKVTHFFNAFKDGRLSHAVTSEDLLSFGYWIKEEGGSHMTIHYQTIKLHAPCAV